MSSMTSKYITHLEKIISKDRDLYIDIVFEFCGLDKPSSIKLNYRQPVRRELALDCRSKYLRYG